ncbi:deoxyuridine 5'-triphosphate nucleotidohydrolase [Frigoriflavimonas asaccharolytica]|uniref:tRNA(Met) C34 N-acetyltransferase TmcA n=1 Tax=Frigoriflavimonas asaccharolytica TaxID=2735899 RepID=A0A8J8G8M0_9FLAO|nr:deoxyuridine 5'-triphosphate nucleotidohydrolase [Frigoriflavimonas asaccharolytica]NRS93448.1 tRNA(Met) C34 N-acetyltransferase TmcA [Frigoriflavimonas asaccharolytica]
MEYSKEFKEALSNFSPKEKDKLIFRLIRKDKILSQKLYFELIENITVDEKRKELEDYIVEKVEFYAKNITNAKYYLKLIRELSAKITLHVKVTSDKFGEVYLNLLLVYKILEFHHVKMVRQGLEVNYKLYIYIINKIYRALILTLKLDEDLHLDINSISQKALDELVKIPDMVRLSINNGLDFNFFQTENIPEDLASQIRELKAEGFLR